MSVITILSRPRPAARVGIVAAGYVIAFVIAALVLRIYVAATASPDRIASGGMFAFGDSLLFLAVLGVGALPATALALFYLRSQLTFWLWRAIAPLRILVAPLLALFFLLSGVFAPTRVARLCLLGASAIEFVAFASVVFTWVTSTR